MKLTIINGTNRKANRSMGISHAVGKIAREKSFDVNLITLNNFDTLFRGTYIRVENASSEQKRDMRNLITADIILFVIPTYHAGIPSSLKNFLDTLKCNECYEQKVIGVISSNSGNKDLGARQAVQVINGILAHEKLISSVIPIIPIVNYDDIDHTRIEKYIHYCSQFLR